MLLGSVSKKRSLMNSFHVFLESWETLGFGMRHWHHVRNLENKELRWLVDRCLEGGGERCLHRHGQWTQRRPGAVWLKERRVEKLWPSGGLDLWPMAMQNKAAFMLLCDCCPVLC